MHGLKVRVQGGRIVGEAPKGLAEGTELELCMAEPEEEMSDEELAALDRVLDAAWQSIAEGRVRSAAEVLAELRKQS
jgi:hypothetical protein